MAFDDYRLRNYMTPPQIGDYGTNFNVATGAGPWATPNTRPKPFTGMEFQGPQIPEPMQVQGPINSFARSQPEPYRGMEIQGPLGVETDPKGGGYAPGWGPNKTARPEVQTPSMPEDSPKEFDIFERMYNAPTPALEAYKRHIMSAPKREDYSPGKYDRFAAALTGAAEGMNRGAGAGYQASRAMIDNPYLQAMQQHQVEGQGLGTLAELESNDMKGKMAYAKTAMEQRRADTKEAREGKRTDAEVAKLEAELPLIGKSIETSPADGQKYVVDRVKGTRTSLGKFDLTPEEKAEIARKSHKINAGVDFGNQKAMAGVNFGYTKEGKAIDQENAIGRFALEEGTRSANRVREHETNRKVDAENPIPSSSFDFTAPSQDSIATISAMQKASLDDPRFLAFQVDSLTMRQDAAEDDPELYKAYQAAVKKNKEDIIANSMRRPIGGAARPEVKLPAKAETTAAPIVQSPLGAPTIEDTPQRIMAKEMFKERNPGQTPSEAQINAIVAQLPK